MHPLYHLEKKLETDYQFELVRGWKETRWIVVSSSFFSIPAIVYWIHFSYESFCVAESNQSRPSHILFSILLILTSLVSMNYWRNAKRGWRRNMDMILAKITFLTGGYYSIQYIQNFQHLFVIFSSSFLAVCLYGKSSNLIAKNDRNWVKYHFIFHIFLGITAWVVLRGINQT